MKASTYFKAAKIIDDPSLGEGFVYGACDALVVATRRGQARFERSDAVNAFCYTFSPRIDSISTSYWGDQWCIDEKARCHADGTTIWQVRKNCRVLALLFAAEMAKTGDLV